jgi:hypothetical protein
MLAACRASSVPPSVAFPLGLGPEVQFGVHGATNSKASLAVRGSYVALAWTATETAGAPHVYVATSADNGRSFSQPRRVDASADRASIEALPAGGGVQPSGPALSERPSVSSEEVIERLNSPTADHIRTAIDDSRTLVVVWDESGSAARRIVMRRLLVEKHDIVQALPLTVVSGEVQALDPVVASVPGGVIVAWTSGPSSSSVIAMRRVGLATMCLDLPGAGESDKTIGLASPHTHEHQ